jgi:hypothetical protein
MAASSEVMARHRPTARSFRCGLCFSSHAAVKAGDPPAEAAASAMSRCGPYPIISPPSLGGGRITGILFGFDANGNGVSEKMARCQVVPKAAQFAMTFAAAARRVC